MVFDATELQAYIAVKQSEIEERAAKHNLKAHKLRNDFTGKIWVIVSVVFFLCVALFHLVKKVSAPAKAMAYTPRHPDD